MDREAVMQVRRFSRLVTQRVGALDEDYLRQSRPLSQARVLWEIGASGCEVGVLRARLELDSAQLSRTLRALEGDGLIVVAAHEQDSRVREATLTESGRRAWRELEAGSDAAAESILEPLSERQRARLLDAMGQVERLLIASMVEIGPCAVSDPLARSCLRSYVTELEDRFGTSFDAGSGDADLAPPRGLFLVATLRHEPIGCGGIRLSPDEPPEIKRLWTAPAARGLGLGRRLLGELESRAIADGASSVRLDTNKTLTEAMALYRSAGYVEIPRYNDNPHAHHWFEKQLD